MVNELDLKRLREVAEAAVDARCDTPGTYWGPLAVALEPTALTVLALLDRLEAAEAKVARIEALADWADNRGSDWAGIVTTRVIRERLAGEPS